MHGTKIMKASRCSDPVRSFAVCKEYVSNYRKLATKTVYLQPEQQHEQ